MASIQNANHEILPQPEFGIMGNGNHEIFPQPENGIMGNGNHEILPQPENGIMGNGNHEIFPQPENIIMGNGNHEILPQLVDAIMGNGNHEILPHLEDGIMASIQNGNNHSPSESDEDIMVSIQNGNHESPPQLDDSVVKVVVIGEPKCGKTKFIRAYYEYHFPGGMYSHNGVKVYPCKLEGFNQYRRVSIFEIPSNPDFFFEQRIPHYEDANIFIFMYSIDDPTSLQMLYEKWIVEAIDVIKYYNLPVLFVGNKKDLQDDEQVIQRLALENRSFVTYEQGKEVLESCFSNGTIMECSANDLSLVELVFNTIYAIVQMTEQ